MSEVKDIVTYLNEIISSLKPITYDEFNNKFEFKDLVDLDNINCIVTKDNKLSTISLLISVIEHLTNERIAFEIDDDTKIIKGVQKIFKGQQ